MRRSRSRLAAANGFAFDHVKPGSVRPAASHASRSTRPGTGVAARPVRRRISSLAGLGVQVAAQHGGERAGPRRGEEAGDGARLLLPDRAVVPPPAQVRAEHLHRPARAVDLREHAQPLLAFVVGRAPCAATGEREHLVAPDRPPRQHRVPGAHPAGVEVRGVHGLGAARARRRARAPGCGARPPTPPGARACRRRSRAGSRRSPGGAPPTARSDPTGSRSRCAGSGLDERPVARRRAAPAPRALCVPHALRVVRARAPHPGGAVTAGRDEGSP